MAAITFKARHFQHDMILQSVHWYLAYSLSYRDIEEMMAERGFTVVHSTIHRWVLHYSPQ
jgi:transposase-like protein